MDTDELSKKTYNTIMVEAEKFNHDLTLQFGLLSYECESEKQFIEKSKLLIKEMLEYDEDDIDDMFFGNPPETNDFHKALNKILDNISKLNIK
ncbi:MAG: hypothetical protein ABI863_19800 [Ginsengibacter sp.]